MDTYDAAFELVAHWAAEEGVPLKVLLSQSNAYIKSGNWKESLINYLASRRIESDDPIYQLAIFIGNEVARMVVENFTPAGKGGVG